MKSEHSRAKETSPPHQGQPPETVFRSPDIEQLKLMLNSVPARIAYVDNAWVCRWVNQEYERSCGISSERCVGRLALDALKEQVGDEYAEFLRPYMEQALAGTKVAFEATYYYGGQRNDVLVSYSPDRAADGTVRGFVALTTDQTEQRRIERGLKASEQQLRTLMEMLPSTIWTATPHGELDYISHQFQKDTGLPPAAGLGSGWTEIIHPEDLACMIHCRDAAVASGKLFEAKCRVRLRNSTYRWYLLRALPERDQNGDIVRWLGIATDIDSQVLAERAVRESERRYRLLFEDNPIPMFTYDRQTLQILSANDLALKKYGYSREELLQKRITDIRPEEDIPALLQMLHDPPEGSTVGPLRHRRKDGSVFWVAVTCHSLSGEDPALRIIVAQDVSEQVRLNAELVRRANYDLLTGLPNRSLLIDRFRLAVERAKRTGQRIAVLAIDFDRFKQVNDAFGHQIGDEFLKLSTLSLLSALRQTDTLARVGGDEFIVLADCLNSTEACTEIAARLITALNNPISVRDLELQSSISIGIAFYPDDGDDFEEIHRRADYSLYQAKRSGRGCWRYYSQHETYGIQESMEIERSLRKALSDGRFELHYQPIVSPDKEVVKLEALLRFPHPTLGLLSPARFVPVAEETGLIAPIGQWVLQQACRQIQQWHSEGLSVVPIAVNVSAAQFLHGNLADDIRKLLEEFEVEPNLLEIELTESLLMENTEYSWEQLRVLKRAGIRIAVDDFGTGYSSLSYLHLLPLARISHRC